MMLAVGEEEGILVALTLLACHGLRLWLLTRDIDWDLLAKKALFCGKLIFLIFH